MHRCRCPVTSMLNTRGSLDTAHRAMSPRTSKDRCAIVARLSEDDYQAVMPVP